MDELIVIDNVKSYKILINCTKTYKGSAHSLRLEYKEHSHDKIM